MNKSDLEFSKTKSANNKDSTNVQDDHDDVGERSDDELDDVAPKV